VKSSRLALMSPFPVVRLAGSVVQTGARVRVLEVKAPRGAKITVRCIGKSCTKKRVSKRAGRKRARFPAVERFLRAGTVVAVRVRQPGFIGKYTHWKIHGGKLPKRTDRCLYPGRAKPARCPDA
jgi:hypothetical protein